MSVLRVGCAISEIELARVRPIGSIFRCPRIRIIQRPFMFLNANYLQHDNIFWQMRGHENEQIDSNNRDRSAVVGIDKLTIQSKQI